MKKQNVECFISTDLEKITELINNHARVWEYTIDDIALTNYRINDKKFYECLVTFSTKKSIFAKLFVGENVLLGISIICLILYIVFTIINVVMVFNI